MQRSRRWMVVALIAGLSLAACSKTSNGGGEPESAPAKLERVKGTTLSRVILTAKAAERIGIEMAEVRDAPTAGGGPARKVIPYAAVLYDANGDTWTYTNPRPRTFVRARISVDRIDGDVAVLSDGPPASTTVVTVGAAELFGTEFGLFEED